MRFQTTFKLENQLKRSTLVFFKSALNRVHSNYFNMYGVSGKQYLLSLIPNYF